MPLLAALLLFATGVYAQSGPPALTGWNENPHLQVLDSKYTNEPAVILFSRVSIDYTDDPKGRCGGILYGS